MFEQIMPVLPLLVVCHAWMCFMLARVLEDEDIHPLSPECFPA